jgi:LCP family protein required for cell wall assembly
MDIEKSNPFAHKTVAPKKNFFLRSFLVAFLLIIISILSYGGFFAYKTYSVSKQVSIQNNTPQPSFTQTIKQMTTTRNITLQHTDPDRINVLLLGIAGKGKPGQYLTDTIIVASLNIKTNQIALLSIPRDLYVKIPGLNIQTKINSVYQISLNNSKENIEAMKLVKETITDVTSLPIDYFAVLNFAGFEKTVDSIGGVNIMNERDIYDSRYPGPNYSYETFELAKGFHQLNGAMALKYARERHDDPEGDFGRAKRQQQIMQAIKSKIFSVETLANPIALNNLLNTIGENVTTDATPIDIENFFELTKKLDTQNITNKVVDAWSADSLLSVTHIEMGGAQAFVLIPRIGNWSEIHDLAQNIFDLNILTRKKAEIEKENANILIINRSGNSQIINNLKNLFQENLSYKNITTASERTKELQEKTIVYDLTDGMKPFTANELITKLPATISYDITNIPLVPEKNKPDVIIVIGKDLVAKYTLPKATIDDLNNFHDDQEKVEYNKN